MQKHSCTEKMALRTWRMARSVMIWKARQLLEVTLTAFAGILAIPYTWSLYHTAPSRLGSYLRMTHAAHRRSNRT
jgi:hypothetical protein